MVACDTTLAAVVAARVVSNDGHCSGKGVMDLLGVNSGGHGSMDVGPFPIEVGHAEHILVGGGCPGVSAVFGGDGSLVPLVECGGRSPLLCGCGFLSVSDAGLFPTSSGRLEAHDWFWEEDGAGRPIPVRQHWGRLVR